MCSFVLNKTGPQAYKAPVAPDQRKVWAFRWHAPSLPSPPRLGKHRPLFRNSSEFFDSLDDTPLLEARRTNSKFHPSYLMADTGYSGQGLIDLLKRQYRTKPIIKFNKTHKRLMEQWTSTMETVEWKALYAQRQAVERVFSRLKGQHSLKHITARGWRKVTVHCYLALIAMQSESKVCSTIAPCRE